MENQPTDNNNDNVTAAGRLNLNAPRYDQSTFEGRLKYFAATTNPKNVLASTADLEKAKEIVNAYKNGTEDKSLSEEDIWHAKELYDSAFHPETGELMFLPGRMSFQVPGNMVITGCMITFYKTTPAVMFWQFANQSFNALVNYTNRNASANSTPTQLGMAYAAATTASVGSALALNKIVAKFPILSAGMVGRLVPFAAVAAANWVNIPLMRQQEIKDGIAIETQDGKQVGLSSNAAKSAILQVVPSRILMAMPGFVLPGLVMNRLEKTAMLIKNPWLKAPLTVSLCTVAFSKTVVCVYPYLSHYVFVLLLLLAHFRWHWSACH